MYSIFMKIKVHSSSFQMPKKPLASFPTIQNSHPVVKMLIPTPNPKPKFQLLSTMSKAVTSPNSYHLSHPKLSLPQTDSTLKICNKRPIFFAGVSNSSIESEELSRGFNNDEDEMGLVVVSFYKFAEFKDCVDMRKPLRDLCEEVRVSGGIILAPEGINGSICGTRESVDKVLEFIQTDDRLKGLRMIESPVTPEDVAIHHGHVSQSPLGAGEDAPFRWDHVRVKVKKEIVSFGDPSVMPTEKVGKYVHPKEWNALINDPDTVVVDVRNTYETRIGKFKGAVDPSTTAFREFPRWVDDQFELDKHIHESNKKLENAVPKNTKLPRIAMYCTGGIRCEKASSFLLRKGFPEVYHLEGGILKYLEEVPKKESLWEGECFVFDKRVSVDHGLLQGSYKLCYGCKQPISDEDMESPEYEYGVSCPYCISTKSQEEKERARARQRQFETWGVIGGPDKGRKKIVEEN